MSDQPQLNLPLVEVLAHAPHAVAVFSEQGDVLVLNPAMMAFLATLESLAARQTASVACLSDFLSRLGWKEQGWNQLQAVAEGSAGALLAVNGLKGVAQVRLQAATLEQPGTAPLHMLTLIDCTELGRARHQRDQALGFLSHDMRSPVASILALTEQLGRTAASGSPQQQAIARLAAHGEQLMRSMNGFSMQSRAHGETMPRAERLLDDLLEEAVAQTQAGASRQRMRLVVVASEAYFFVQVATELVVRALHNMLMSAVQHGEPGTPIQLLTRRAGTSAQPLVEIEVCHQRASAVREVDKSLAEGLGWGLDLAEIVASRHGGHLSQPLSAEGHARLVLSLPCLADTEF